MDNATTDNRPKLKRGVWHWGHLNVLTLARTTVCFFLAEDSDDRDDDDANIGEDSSNSAVSSGGEIGADNGKLPAWWKIEREKVSVDFVFNNIYLAFKEVRSLREPSSATYYGCRWLFILSKVTKIVCLTNTVETAYKVTGYKVKSLVKYIN